MEKKQNKLRCIKCKKIFSNLSNLRKHVKGIHPEEDSYLKSLQIRKTTEEKQISYCDICDKTFSTAFNLKKHLKRLHAYDSIDLKRLEIQDGLVEEQVKQPCDLCQKEFSNLSNLRQHIKRLHGKPNKFSKRKENQFLCDKCPKKFMFKTNLRSHLRTHNATEVQALRKDKCAFCDYFSDKKTLLIHYEEEHNIPIEKTKYTFATVEDFYSWKEMYENESSSKFIKEFNTLRGGHIYKGFRCHRSGIFSSRSKGIRRLKIYGSVKIDGFCPANIKLKKNNSGEYDVYVVHTHVGHQLDIRYLNLTKLERKSLATKVALKIPFDDILDEVRNSICDSNLKRFHFLTKKDLHNIETSLNLYSNSERYSNDIIIELSSKQENKAHLTELSSISSSTIILDTRRRLTDEIIQLLELIKVVGPEELSVIQKCITPIKPTLEAIKNSKKIVSKSQNLVQNKILYQRRKKLIDRKELLLRKPDTSESN